MHPTKSTLIKLDNATTKFSLAVLGGSSSSLSHVGRCTVHMQLHCLYMIIIQSAKPIDISLLSWALQVAVALLQAEAHLDL